VGRNQRRHRLLQRLRFVRAGGAGVASGVSGGAPTAPLLSAGGAAGPTAAGALGGAATDLDPSMHTVRFGLNFKF